MKHALICLVLFWGGLARAQTISTGAPMPVNIVSGTVSATNPSVGTNGSAIPASSTEVGYKDGSGNLQPLSGSINGIKVDGSAVTQPISGTVTGNQGSAAALAGAWPTKVTDGTNTMPTMDASARKGFFQPTDGTNSATYTAVGEAKVSVTQPLPAGTNVIGTVNSRINDSSGNAVTVGQKTMASSLPVTMASDQVAPKTYPNSAGSQATNSAITTTATTLSAPANSVGFIIQAKDSNSANLRWAVGATASASVGQQLQPGRDSGYIPVGASVSVASESGTQEVEIQWVTQ